MSRRTVPRSITLRCLLEHDEADSWFAICLDLNVYVRARTCGQARARLRGEIDHYLQEAYTKDRKHFRDLVLRPAPIRFWVSYYLAGVLQKISRPRPPRRVAGFRAKVPLAPAHG